MKINLLGWYGKRNAGDEAFRIAMEFIFAGHTLQYVTPPANLPPADLTILGGGNVVSPFYLSKLKDQPFYALGVGIGYESEIALLAKYNVQGVLVRNQTDVASMQAQLPCPVQAIPDLAYLCQAPLKPIREREIGVLITDYVNPAIDRDIGLFGLRSYLFQQGVAKELDWLGDQGYKITLIPCSTGGYGDDRRINLGLQAFMRTQANNILETLGPLEIISLLSGMSAAICMRFHAHIFAHLANTPIISIPFSRKVDLFLQENDLTDFIGMRIKPETDTSMFREVFQNLPKQQLPEINVNALLDIKKTIRRDWLQESA